MSNLKKPQRSLRAWTKQKWRTKSGKKSSETGERYLPEKAIKALSAEEYARTTRKKREDTKKGKQHSKQPKKVARKTTTKKKSTVNKAGNYTKPTMRKRLFEKIKAGTKGGKAGQWSARKAQLLAKEYKAKGGGYK